MPAKTKAVSPLLYFVVSSVFHYLGPAFAVLLFAHVAPLGVAWLRIASAAVVFALWRRPWQVLAASTPPMRWLLVTLGAVLAVMNVCFYLAIAKLPLATVGTIEFFGPIAVAAAGARTRRNGVALGVAVLGVAALTRVHLAGALAGFGFAFADCALFLLYIVIGHRIARDGGAAGIDRLAAAMLIAVFAVSPIGFAGAAPAFSHVAWLLAGIGVGLASSVIPYVTDQLAMARLPRATFALFLAILPAMATVIGAVVLRQLPRWPEVAGVVLVMVGIVLHESPAAV